MKMRIYEVKLKYYQHLSDEVLLERSRKSLVYSLNFLELMWVLEGPEGEKVETVMDRLDIEDMKIYAVLSAREDHIVSAQRY